MKKISLLATLAALSAGALLLAGCSHDETLTHTGEAVNFTARITAGTQATRTANPQTRTTSGITDPATRTTAGGDSWVTGDVVGVYMLTAGGDISEGGDVLAANAAYIVANAATGALSGDLPIYYPQSGSVDFAAYYPFGTPTGGTLDIDVRGQTTEAAQNALDVLYARTQGVAKSKTAVGLTFDHVLSKVTLNVRAGAGIAAGDVSALAASGVVIDGMPATATLDLQDGALAADEEAVAFTPLKAATAAASFDATFTALIIPSPDDLEGRSVSFTIGDQTFTWYIPYTESFEAGEHYVYPVTVSRTGITVGAPSIADWTTRDNGSGAATEIGAGIPRVFIPAGTFTMGSPTGEPDRNTNETQHSVTLTKGFYMSQYETTNTQYAEFLNAVGVPEAGVHETVFWDVAGFVGQQPIFVVNEWGWTPKWNDAESRWVADIGNTPMINVTWYGARAYADWVGGTLPTEAQWEYACRASSTTAFSYGDAADGNYMWYGDNSGIGPSAVGQKLPNAWGLYDMHGNVSEWCADWYGEDYYNNPAADTDPAGPTSGPRRVLRGGSWSNSAHACRLACRDDASPNHDNDQIGFRVVFPLP